MYTVPSKTTKDFKKAQLNRIFLMNAMICINVKFEKYNITLSATLEIVTVVDKISCMISAFF